MITDRYVKFDARKKSSWVVLLSGALDGSDIPPYDSKENNLIIQVHLIDYIVLVISLDLAKHFFTDNER